ncbi:MAG: four helix bundle protein [Bacteroidetes bacterium]|nr:four helix bundle protein [Bacteroidota bacterium]
MERENIIKDKSYKYALRIINLYKYLIEDKKEYVLSKQILRSGTSIGANIEEGIGSPSKKDFINKFFVAHKEARESHYWIRLLRDSKYLDYKLAESLLNDCDEILKITGKIISTSRKSI